MNKAGLIQELTKRTKFSAAECNRMLDCMMEIVTTTLQKHEKVTISKFGTWEIRDRAKKIGRNPKTGIEVEIPPTKVAKFIPSKKLKASINKEN